MHAHLASDPLSGFVATNGLHSVAAEAASARPTQSDLPVVKVVDKPTNKLEASQTQAQRQGIITIGGHAAGTLAHESTHIADRD